MMRLPRKLLPLLAASAGWMMCAGSLLAGQPPNLVLILVDDLGYGDLSCYGRTAGPPTPQTDRLAAEGVRLTNAYASSPICSATRAGLITGRYQQRFGYYGNFEFQVGLPATEQTIPQYLQQAGYTSALMGKWHLGEQPDKHPLQFGFDEFFGFLGGQHDYFDAHVGHTWVYGSHSEAPILDGYEPVSRIQYLTHELTDRGVRFIQRHRDRPFFLMLSYNAIHGPLQVPDRYLDRFGGSNSPRDRSLAMNLALDEGVGQIMQTLRSCGIAENTLTIYCSDNGGANHSRNAPLRGAKGQRYEGGQRVPFIAHWPEKLPRGAERDGLVMTIDILPTFLAAAGITPPADRALDGKNLIPHLKGEADASPHEVLFWSMKPAARKWAVRRGDWKLISERNRVLELYHLGEDSGETRDRMADQPEIAQELESLYRQWIKEMAPSLVTDANRIEKQRKE